MRERGAVGEAERPVHLYGAVDYSREHIRRVELQQRDLDARVRALVDLVRGVEREQTTCLDLGGRVGDPVLHGLLLRERAAECLAFERPGAHELERALHLAEPAHDVMDAAGPEPLLGDQEAGAALAQEVRLRHAYLLVGHLAVRRPAPAPVAEDRDRLDRDARRVGGDDDLAHAPTRFCVGLRDRHDDPEARALGA